MAKGFTAQLNDILEDFYEVVRDEFEGLKRMSLRNVLEGSSL